MTLEQLIFILCMIYLVVALIALSIDWLALMRENRRLRRKLDRHIAEDNATLAAECKQYFDFEKGANVNAECD